MLGRLAGVCDTEKRTIRVKTKNASKGQIAFAIRHELEHAGGAEHATSSAELGLHCAGRL